MYSFKVCVSMNKTTIKYINEIVESDLNKYNLYSITTKISNISNFKPECN